MTLWITTSISREGKNCEHCFNSSPRAKQLKGNGRTQKISTPYFREWSNMRLHKGKSFLAPPRLFKGERALYFPNFYGQTLLKDKVLRDTTPTLEDKISVVSVFSSAWAENQAATFASRKNNPELHEVVKNSGGLAQMIQINVEENALKAMLVRLFMPSLRRRLGHDNWGRYFLVRRGISDQIRDAVGLLNSKVGYTYLLDGECKIRWAGSGPCEGDEKDGLVKGTRRLIEELTTKRKEKPTPLPQKAVLEADNQKVAATAA
jgi:ATPase complex subunit ATP10